MAQPDGRLAFTYPVDGPGARFVHRSPVARQALWPDAHGVLGAGAAAAGLLGVELGVALLPGGLALGEDCGPDWFGELPDDPRREPASARRIEPGLPGELAFALLDEELVPVEAGFAPPDGALALAAAGFAPSGDVSLLGVVLGCPVLLAPGGVVLR